MPTPESTEKVADTINGVLTQSTALETPLPRLHCSSPTSALPPPNPVAGQTQHSRNGSVHSPSPQTHADSLRHLKHIFGVIRRHVIEWGPHARWQVTVDRLPSRREVGTSRPGSQSHDVGAITLHEEELPNPSSARIPAEQLLSLGPADIAALPSTALRTYLGEAVHLLRGKLSADETPLPRRYRFHSDSQPAPQWGVFSPAVHPSEPDKPVAKACRDSEMGHAQTPSNGLSLLADQVLAIAQKQGKGVENITQSSTTLPWEDSNACLRNNSRSPMEGVGSVTSKGLHRDSHPSTLVFSTDDINRRSRSGSPAHQSLASCKSSQSLFDLFERCRRESLKPSSPPLSDDTTAKPFPLVRSKTYSGHRPEKSTDYSPAVSSGLSSPPDEPDRQDAPSGHHDTFHSASSLHNVTTKVRHITDAESNVKLAVATLGSKQSQSPFPLFHHDDQGTTAESHWKSDDGDDDSSVHSDSQAALDSHAARPNGPPISQGKNRTYRPISFSKFKRKPLSNSGNVGYTKPRSSKGNRLLNKRKHSIPSQQVKRGRIHSKPRSSTKLTIRIPSLPRGHNPEDGRGSRMSRAYPEQPIHGRTNGATGPPRSPYSVDDILNSASDAGRSPLTAPMRGSGGRTILEAPMGRLDINTQAAAQYSNGSSSQPDTDSDIPHTGLLPPLVPVLPRTRPTPSSPSTKEGGWRELMGRISRRGQESGGDSPVRRRLEEKLYSPIKRLTASRHSTDTTGEAGSAEAGGEEEGNQGASSSFRSLFGLKKRPTSLHRTGSQAPTSASGGQRDIPAPDKSQEGYAGQSKVPVTKPIVTHAEESSGKDYQHQHPSVYSSQVSVAQGSRTTSAFHPPVQRTEGIPVASCAATSVSNGGSAVVSTMPQLGATPLPTTSAGTSGLQTDMSHTSSRYYRQVTASRMAPYITTSRFGIPYHPTKRRRSVYAKWSSSEDILLRVATCKYREKNWDSIAREVPGRTYHQCRQRWNKTLKFLNPLTPEELKTGKLAVPVDVEGARATVLAALENAKANATLQDMTPSESHRDLSNQRHRHHHHSSSYVVMPSVDGMVNPYLHPGSPTMVVDSHYTARAPPPMMQSSALLTSSHTGPHPRSVHRRLSLATISTGGSPVYNGFHQSPVDARSTGLIAPPSATLPSFSASFPKPDVSAAYPSASSSSSSLVPGTPNGYPTVAHSSAGDSHVYVVSNDPVLPRGSENLPPFPPSPSAWGSYPTSPIAHKAFASEPHLPNPVHNGPKFDNTTAEERPQGYRRHLQKVSSKIGRIMHGNSVSDASKSPLSPTVATGEIGKEKVTMSNGGGLVAQVVPSSIVSQQSNPTDQNIRLPPPSTWSPLTEDYATSQHQSPGSLSRLINH
ncbi:hypothetical protein IWQ62_001423 [Dispira parvispora]|uniref:Uncharacterized protein n=1 Tax=Dispira parvispora TaxID=1520584 RepID=A0A9W8ATL6_9FUNG|nr:hypothetical protein IWQ62_001423 [Dispira parvispora]